MMRPFAIMPDIWFDCRILSTVEVTNRKINQIPSNGREGRASYNHFLELPLEMKVLILQNLNKAELKAFARVSYDCRVAAFVTQHIAISRKMNITQEAQELKCRLEKLDRLIKTEQMKLRDSCAQVFTEKFNTFLYEQAMKKVEEAQSSSDRQQCWKLCQEVDALTTQMGSHHKPKNTIVEQGEA